MKQCTNHLHMKIIYNFTIMKWKMMKLKMKCFSSIVVIKITNRIIAIEIVHTWNRATHFFENHLNFRFNVKKNVSCAKKSIVDRLITFSKNEMIQSKNSKIKNFIFELNLILTKKFNIELSNMKTKTKTKRFIFSIFWLSILKHIMLILIDLKKLNQIRLICINFSFHINHSKISNHWSLLNNSSKISWFIKSTNATKLLHRFRLHHMCSIQSQNCDTIFSNSKNFLLIQKQQRNQMQTSINSKHYNALIIRSKSIIARRNRSVSFSKWTQHHRSIQSILIRS